MIDTLLQTMKDQSNPRVQAHAAAALINFTEDCPKSLLIQYLDRLVQHLHSIMVVKLQEVRLDLAPFPPRPSVPPLTPARSLSRSS